VPQILNYSKLKGSINRLFLNYLFSKNIDSRLDVMVFSDPRGGSTWLTEILYKIVKKPIIWEPLDPIYNKNVENLNFGYRQYLPEDLQWEEAYKVFDKILRGKNLAYYHLTLTNLRELSYSDSFLIKFCRGGALLPWIINNFELKYSPIYLVRHPMAVISSQLLHGSWPSIFHGFEIPSIKYDEIYSKHATFIKSIKSIEESMAFVWCVSNTFILNHRNNDENWITLYYEDFVLDPLTCLNKILTRWGLEYDLDKLNINQPSITSFASKNINSEEQLAKWKRHLSSSQILNIQRVMDYFELETYSKELFQNA
jgi:hypothetical protein